MWSYGGSVSIGFYFISLRLKPFSHIDLRHRHSTAPPSIQAAIVLLQRKKMVPWYNILCGIDFIFASATFKPRILTSFVSLWNMGFLPSGYQLICIARWAKKIGSKESEAPGGVERVVRCKNEMQMKQSCDNIDEVQLHNGMVCAGFGNEISNLRDKWTLTCTMEWPTFYYSFHIFFTRTVCWIPFHSTATHKTCQRLKVWIGWPKRDSEMGRNDNTIRIVHTCMYNCKYERSTTQCDGQMQSV